MKRPPALATVFVLALVLIGCSLFPPSGAERPALSTDRTAYDAGDRLTLRLENRTGRRLGYNLCFSELERRTENGWPEVAGGWMADGIDCDAILRLLPAGQSGIFTETLRQDLPRGTYRFAARVEVGEAYDERTLVPNATYISNAFVIR